MLELLKNRKGKKKREYVGKMKKNRHCFTPKVQNHFPNALGLVTVRSQENGS